MCKQDVEPTVTDVMPRATIGHRTAATMAWCHYELGITIKNITRFFSQHLKTHLIRNLNPFHARLSQAR